MKPPAGQTRAGLPEVPEEVPGQVVQPLPHLLLGTGVRGQEGVPGCPLPGWGDVIRDLPRPQCQPNQTCCTAGEALLTLCAGLWARALPRSDPTTDDLKSRVEFAGGTTVIRVK